MHAVATTADTARYWAHRHETFKRGATAWLEHYWNDGAAPHRRELVATLAGLDRPHKPIRSALELGCNVGTNLRLLGEAVPSAALSGCDVNAEAIAYGQARLERSSLYVAPILDHLGTLRSGSVDVVFSCYALAYVAPLDLPRTLRAMLRVARRALVLAEPAVLRSDGPLYEQTREIPEWRHHWGQLFAKFGIPRGRVSIVEIDAPEYLNAILSLEVA